jgi:4-hydroxy-2-oxoheptanedioate aldolase
MNLEMRRSKVLEKMRAGKIAVSAKLNMLDPTGVELVGIAGFDAIWLDMEHVPCDWDSITAMIRTAKAYDMDTMVRVAKGSYSDLIRPFEADATGIIYPHLMNLEEAKKLVHFTKYHPLGRRPLDGGNADAKYCQMDVAEYVKLSNREKFVMAQIEDPEPLAELEEIVKLPGIDIIFFGPGDFSQGVGAPGNFSHPEVLRVKKLIGETCRKHGRFASTPGSPEAIPELAAMGYTFVNIGADVYGLGLYWNDLINRAGKILEKLS